MPCGASLSTTTSKCLLCMCSLQRLPSSQRSVQITSVVKYTSALVNVAPVDAGHSAHHTSCHCKLTCYVPEWILDVNSCLQICSIPVQCPTYDWTSSCVCPTYGWTSSCVCPTYDWTSSCVCPTYDWTSSCVCPTYGWTSSCVCPTYDWTSSCVCPTYDWTSSCIVSRVHGYITCVVCSRATHINTVVTVVSTVPGLQQPPLPLVHAVYVQYICMHVAVGLCSSLHDCF